MNKLIATAAAALLSSSALAATPENGWWWNPAESGTGWNLEFQDGTMFASTFIYDDAGNPIWLSGSGSVNRNNVATIELMRSTGGPCLGCQYSPVTSSGTGQTVTFQFTDDDSGTIIMGQQEKPIQRFNFNYGNGAQKMLGGWVLTILTPTTLDMGLSDIIGYSRIESGNAVGSRGFNSRHFTTAGPLSDGNYAMMTDLGGATMLAFYQFSGLNRIIGFATVADSRLSAEEMTDQLFDKGVLFAGYRGGNSADVQTKSTNIDPIDTSELDSLRQDVEAVLTPEKIRSIGERIETIK